MRCHDQRQRYTRIHGKERTIDDEISESTVRRGGKGRSSDGKHQICARLVHAPPSGRNSRNTNRRPACRGIQPLTYPSSLLHLFGPAEQVSVPPSTVVRPPASRPGTQVFPALVPVVATFAIMPSLNASVQRFCRLRCRLPLPSHQTMACLCRLSAPADLVEG